MVQFTTSRAALVLLLELGITSCTAAPLAPLDPNATPTPDDLLRRIVAVAQSGAVRDPTVSEQLLGLRWEGELRDPAGQVSLQAKGGPRWVVGGAGFANAHLRAGPPGPLPPRPRRRSWRETLDLHLDPQVVCIPTDQVLSDFGRRGEWRLGLVVDAPSYFFFAVRSVEAEVGEIWFIPTGPGQYLYSQQPGCIAAVSIMQGCNRRCGGLVVERFRNDRVFGPSPPRD